MLTIERHDDVTRVRMTSWRGRLVGYDVSAYLVRGVLIDTGFPHVAREFARFLDEKLQTIRGVIVTHWHEDHAGNAALVAARGLPVAIAPSTLAQLAESRGVPEPGTDVPADETERESEEEGDAPGPGVDGVGP